MTFDTFKATILDSLGSFYGEDYTLSIHSIPKNNDIILDGLTIQEKNCNISPTIYLNPYYQKYQNGFPLFGILEDIKNVYATNRPVEDIDLHFFTDFDNVKNRICMKLVHYEKNRELLKEVPHVRFLDLAVVFYYFIHLVPGENATILIYNSHIKHWDVTQDTLYQLAKRNTPLLLPYYLDDIFSILTGLEDLTEYADRHTTPLYVLTNSEKLFGAAAILYPELLSTISNKMNREFIILPSSIHEVLLLPVSDSREDFDYHSIIEDVNQTQLSPEEILSDHAYYYSKNKGLIPYSIE